MLFTTAEIGNFSVFYAIFSDLKNSFFGPTPILIIQHKDAFIFLFKAGERDLPKINFLGPMEVCLGKKFQNIPSYLLKFRKIGLFLKKFKQLRTQLNLRSFNRLSLVSDENVVFVSFWGCTNF